MQKQYRQGDVLFVQVKEIPAGDRKVRKSGHILEGESTGERGYKPADQIIPFANDRLTHRPTECTKESFAKTLLTCGWTEKEIDEAWEERQRVAA